MSNDRENTTDGRCFRFFSPEQVDEILRDGAERGTQGSHAAIERILKHEPGIQRAELRRRIRRLKYPPRGPKYHRSVWDAEDEKILRRGYATDWWGKREAVRGLLDRHPDWRPHVIWKRAAKLGLVQRCSRPEEDRSRKRWSEDEDWVLLNRAGCKRAMEIGKLLHRSAKAVRQRLARLGKSSRIHRHGYARRALAEELHMGVRTIQRLIVQGLLEVRDPRITRESLNALRQSACLSRMPCGLAPEATVLAPSPQTAATTGLCEGQAGQDALPGSTMPAKASRAKRAWAKAAKTLNVSVETIENLIRRGILKLHNPRITEKSLRNFCRRYGSLVNYDFLSPETRYWLESSMDFVRDSGQAFGRRSEPYRKQARVTRQCPSCGRSIRGNVYFRHMKVCGESKTQSV
jgi:hypothetical protein